MIPELPTGEWKEKKNGVLAEGEATGHMHVLAGGAFKLWEDGENMCAVVERPAVLSHQEHGPVVIDKGVWKVTRQQEYTPEKIRRVQD